MNLKLIVGIILLKCFSHSYASMHPNKDDYQITSQKDKRTLDQQDSSHTVKRMKFEPSTSLIPGSMGEQIT